MAGERRGGNFRGSRKSEYDQKLIDLRRVARVVAGGRRFSFRAALVVGDRKGKVGLGLGKGADTALSLEKALRQAKKNFVEISLTKESSIPFEIDGKFGAAYVRMRPARSGRGLVAGGPVRTILDLAGVKNTTAKILSHTKNRINNARAALEALKKLNHPRYNKKK